MEFSFDCEKALSLKNSEDNIAILDAKTSSKFTHPMHSSSLSFY